MRIAEKHISQDQSIKYLLECDDKAMTEALYFIHHNRPHFCISSMIGCPEACRFCASGLNGMQRRMTEDEIVTQVELMMRDIQEHHAHLENVTNISYQGMGEPLLNYHSVLNSIVTLKEKCPSVSAYSLSTVGVIRMLKKLLMEETLYIDQLYISLHAADQQKRIEIIPLGKTNPIDDLVQTGADFARRVGKPTVASYLLLDGFNDSEQDAYNLLKLVDHAHYRLQILLFNPIFGLPFVRVTDEKAYAFCEKLRRGGLDAYVTLSRGRDIDGGCGQLRIKRSFAQTLSGPA
jgi:23S rRNA (adenine2503-C2)-methyltransferase